MSNNTVQLSYFGISDIGLAREKNEDIWAAFPDEGLFLLADGMGGHSSGEIASKEACQFLYELFRKWKSEHGPASLDATKKFFCDAFVKVNENIYEKGEKEEGLRGMGTTLCSLYFQKRQAILAHVGDSRIYRLREKVLQQLTEDHTLVSELVALRAMPVEEAKTFPYRHILTRAIGTQSRVVPTISSVYTEHHDLFLICSDGLTNYAGHEKIEEILNFDSSLHQTGQTLVNWALDQGGCDNITLILIRVNS